MGDPKKPKKKYSTPSHPWQKDRIVEETKIQEDYGVKNKKEIWKMRSMIQQFARQAKRIVASPTKQAELEKKQLTDKLRSIGLINESSDFDSVLGITLNDLMEKRLQTLVMRKGLAKTMKQARQFITHQHIAVGDKVITSPSYIVRANESQLITFSKISNFANEEHPERQVKAAPVPVREEKKDDRRGGRGQKDQKRKFRRDKARAPRKDEKKAEAKK
jgi:small subunit ribosomal protein S4